MNKELSVKEGSNLPVDAEALMNMAWGAEDVDNTDIRIPRLLLMQSQSEAVGARQALMGDMVSSATLEKLGDDKNFVKFVPVASRKQWRVEKMKEGKFVFDRNEPWDGKPRATEYEKDNEKYKNFEEIVLLVFLEKDLADESALPYTIHFRSTSLTVGKDISTQMKRAELLKKPVSIFTFSLGTAQTKNDKGTFFVFKTGKPEETKDLPKYISRIREWYELFKAGKVDLTDDPVAGTTAETATQDLSASNVAEKF